MSGRGGQGRGVGDKKILPRGQKDGGDKEAEKPAEQKPGGDDPDKANGTNDKNDTVSTEGL